MKYRLGIDLGTASLGVVAVEMQNDEPRQIAWHALRLFKEPLDDSPKGLQPRSGERRTARLQRRQVERRARRLRRIAHLLTLLGPEWKDRCRMNVRHLTEKRAHAARLRIEPWELGCVLLRMAKRRGYSGGFRASESAAGMVKTASERLQQAMSLLAAERGLDRITLGEYLWYRQENGLPVHLKASRPSLAESDPLYALREMLEHEFQQIWETQAKYHSALNGDYLGRPLKAWFYDALFYQRPLKSIAGMVGNCLLEPNLPRAPKAHPAAQWFRIEKSLHDLRWGGGRRAPRLSRAQLDLLRELLGQPGNADARVSFKQMLAALDEAGLGDALGRSLNLENGGRDGLIGHRTLTTWRKLGLKDQWLALAPGLQTTLINLLADLGSPEVLDQEGWHLKVPRANTKPGDPNPYRKFAPELVRFVDQLREQCNDKGQRVYDRFTTMGFEAGRSSYSIKALERLNAWFADPWWPDEGPGAERRGEVDEEAALRVCYPHLFQPAPARLDELKAAPETGSAVVDVALRQLRRVINQCIAALGSPPQEVIIEMGREVGRGVEWRNEQARRMRENEKVRRKIADSLAAHGLSASSGRVLRYQLWLEQGEQWCPYCNHPISLEAATCGMTHAEHILPRALTQVGRKRSELVLAHASCNDLKGERTPWQAFGSDPQRWAAVERAAAQFEAQGRKLYARDRAKAQGLYRKARLLLLKDYEQDVLSDESLAGFADRQMHQTSWIARVAAQWVKSITPLVSVSRGEMTALLRHQWRLETVIPEVRLDEGFSVLDTERQPVTAEDFARFRRQWEGHPSSHGDERTERRLEKRLDHRHHVIDALVVALTSRSLYMKLARHYREEGERRARGESRRRDWGIAPPMPHLRDQALAMIRGCNLSHKPDRNASGGLFKDKPYGVTRPSEGAVQRLTRRKNLLELADEKSVSATYTAIVSIASEEVRKLVLDTFEARLSAGQSIKEALSCPVDYPRYRTQIWRVRCLTPYKADNVKRITHRSRGGEHHKYLLHAGYACLEIAPIEHEIGCDAKVKRKPAFSTRLITMVEATQPGFNMPAPGVRRLFKGDTVRNSEDGRIYVVAYFQENGRKISLVPFCETRNYGNMKKDGDKNKREIAFSKAVCLELLPDG
ncbi:TPA: type II CRISPR RNA-guided endonuclease Cas9 [Pseudomonas aeruginosa]|uniref:type II CRISPR RNA-guided endonuclease Cas9 n=1 Tax=Pseudomonas aeruginosa TaxID=287 RepID=UPI0009A2A1CC|nr:type II CRISPR RNA-guided endonuclease Cas9 [Pseudomonas aeruginosa]